MEGEQRQRHFAFLIATQRSRFFLPSLEPQDRLEMDPPPPLSAASSLSERAYQCALLGRHMELLLRRAAGSCREQGMQLLGQLAAQQERLLADMRAALLAMEAAEAEQLGEWPHAPDLIPELTAPHTDTQPTSRSLQAATWARCCARSPPTCCLGTSP